MYMISQKKCTKFIHDSNMTEWRSSREAFMLQVDRVHTLSVVRYAPHRQRHTALPVIVLHGGPGGGASPKYLQVLNRRQFDVVMFDQRGCGRSTPTAGLVRNTTAHLVADIERVRSAVRRRTADRRWDHVCVFGASFGAVLAILYAARWPGRVRCVVAHGFTRLRTFFSPKLRRVFPQLWTRLEQSVAEEEEEESRSRRKHAPEAHALYTRCSRALQRGSRRTVRAWNALEGFGTQLSPTTRLRRRPPRPHRRTHTTALLESHYAAHGSFLPKGGVPLRAVAAGVQQRPHPFPIYVVHGKDDVICDVADARAPCATVPRCHLTVVPHAGHAISEPGVLRALRRTLSSAAHDATTSKIVI